MKTYIGGRTLDGTAFVIVEESGAPNRPLEPRADLYNHGSGMDWGYLGSGPAQLALALLADATGEGSLAVQYHQRFKERVVARMREKGWRLTANDVRRILELIQMNRSMTSSEMIH